MQIGNPLTTSQIQRTNRTNSSETASVDSAEQDTSLPDKTLSEQIDDICKAYENGEIDTEDAIEQLTKLGATDILQTSEEGTETITFNLNDKSYTFSKTVETSGLKDLWGKVKNGAKNLWNWIQTPLGLSTVVYGGISILETFCPVLGKIAFAVVSYICGDFGLSQEQAEQAG